MGKNEKSENGTNANGIPQSPTTQKCQNDDRKPSSKFFCIKSLVNLLIYAICILSLSISIYLSYRHHELENNVKSLMYLDKKVSRIESDLEELMRKTAINGDVRRDSIIGDDGDDDYVAKLPVHHVFGELSRLKRDVSKMARRQRQAGAQSPNENCLCPPGESLAYLI